MGSAWLIGKYHRFGDPVITTAALAIVAPSIEIPDDDHQDFDSKLPSKCPLKRTV
jgi:hypothetical protein